MSFPVEYLGAKVARDPHPLPLPLAPVDRKAFDYAQRLFVYSIQAAAYAHLDAGLARYQVGELRCESGMVVQAKWLNYEPYRGKIFQAELLADGRIQTVPEKKGK